jgi:hypothetical protein
MVRKNNSKTQKTQEKYVKIDEFQKYFKPNFIEAFGKSMDNEYPKIFSFVSEMFDDKFKVMREYFDLKFEKIEQQNKEFKEVMSRHDSRLHNHEFRLFKLEGGK